MLFKGTYTTSVVTTCLATVCRFVEHSNWQLGQLWFEEACNQRLLKLAEILVVYLLAFTRKDEHSNNAAIDEKASRSINFGAGGLLELSDSVTVWRQNDLHDHDNTSKKLCKDNRNRGAPGWSYMTCCRYNFAEHDSPLSMHAVYLERMRALQCKVQRPSIHNTVDVFSQVSWLAYCSMGIKRMDAHLQSSTVCKFVIKYRVYLLSPCLGII